MFKPLVCALSTLAALTLGACQADLTPTSTQDASADVKTWPSLAQRLNCLPPNRSLVAAHRGTTKGRGLSENSLESLRLHYAAGVRVAEIDVAQLASGEAILFHDGVWDDKSTGQGAVAGSRWREAQDYLLKNTEGRLTSDRPPRLTDILSYARGRFHLEIDFKSSADYGEVIELIRQQKMEHDVVLISYSTGQARKLARLAPDMFISIGVKKPSDVKRHEEVGVAQDKMMAWVGDNTDPDLLQFLESADIPTLSRKKGEGNTPKPDIYVTDYALKNQLYEGAIRISEGDQSIYKTCLTEAIAP